MSDSIPWFSFAMIAVVGMYFFLRAAPDRAVDEIFLEEEPSSNER